MALRNFENTKVRIEISPTVSPFKYDFKLAFLRIERALLDRLHIGVACIDHYHRAEQVPLRCKFPAPKPGPHAIMADLKGIAIIARSDTSADRNARPGLGCCDDQSLMPVVARDKAGPANLEIGSGTENAITKMTVIECRNIVLQRVEIVGEAVGNLGTFQRQFVLRFV